MGWAFERTYEMLGVRVQVRSEEPRLAQYLDAAHSMFPTVDPRDLFGVIEARSAESGGYAVDFSHVPIAHQRAEKEDPESLPGLVMRVLQNLNSSVIRGTPDRLFGVHCGVLERDGVAIAFPGRGKTGKSTLLTALLQTGGFKYVSDEALLVDRSSGLIQPYPKALWLDRKSLDITGLTAELLPFLEDGYRSPLPVDRLGMRSSNEELGLAAIVVMDRSANRDDDPSIEAVRPARAAGILLKSAFNRVVRSPDNFRFAARLADRSTAIRVRYKEAPQAADHLRSWLRTL